MRSRCSDDFIVVGYVLVLCDACVVAVPDCCVNVGISFVFDEVFQADNSDIALVAFTDDDVAIVLEEALGVVVDLNWY